MPTPLIAYLSAAVVFFGLDYIWLSRVAIGFYRSEIGDLLRDKPNMAAAAAFYLFYIGGIVYFAVIPGLQKESLAVTCFNGALLGLVAYGTYDATNLATLKNWTLNVSVVDVLWGAILTAIAASSGYLVSSYFKG
ncbi:DUF2177 family protein [Rhizobium sp. S95]|uniref:DUF2177 family protein n=1 Tax=Ciceribacter sichuanensis TaxID=2949647 RepID=A0AAJ1C0L7_9HYPH|nr:MULTISPECIES: DUF2177 family protein [unclassified Ciceribacter]MCM2395958.1 DUF2177 family protein [Ciceribacter sp. S95]MCM2404035.1 DUF2177 family protein [Ciceribacter sp. S153]MCO5959626.1 DUF2177 family protein [Ciceribacter sp. S101]